jgi:hypothetical protein
VIEKAWVEAFEIFIDPKAKIEKKKALLNLPTAQCKKSLSYSYLHFS